MFEKKFKSKQFVCHPFYFADIQSLHSAFQLSKEGERTYYFISDTPEEMTKYECTVVCVCVMVSHGTTVM